VLQANVLHSDLHEKEKVTSCPMAMSMAPIRFPESDFPHQEGMAGVSTTGWCRSLPRKP
jgi:hypothetical protein